MKKWLIPIGLVSLLYFVLMYVAPGYTALVSAAITLFSITVYHSLGDSESIHIWKVIVVVWFGSMSMLVSGIVYVLQHARYVWVF